MKTIPTLALLSLLALPVLHAQSAEGFDSPAAAPSAPAPAPATKTAAPAAAAPQAAPAAAKAAPATDAKKIPSRYAGTGPELAAYVESLNARFGIKNRQTDVFGRYQDPNYAAQAPQPAKPGLHTPTFTKIPQTPFPDVVNAVEVNTLIPAKKQFLVGSRKFAVKDVLPIRLPTGKTVKAQVMDVTAQAITFRNPDTGETAVRKMSSLPEGMVRGTAGISAPGMQSLSPNAPIEIQIAPQPPPSRPTNDGASSPTPLLSHKTPAHTMKPAIAVATLLALPTSLVTAQVDGVPAAPDLVQANDPAVPDLPPPAPAPAPPSDLPNIPVAPPPPAPGADSVEPVAPPVAPAPGATAPAAPGASTGQEIQESEEGYLIKDAPINDIFQFLAKQAGRQYFHNAKLATPDYRVTGHLNDGNPLNQMEELAFMYGLTLYTKGNTIYALSQAQLGQLPSAEFNYQLRYLRPTDMEQITKLLTPVLTPGTGIVNFEPKTNTIVIVDTAHRIEQAKHLLESIDRAKGQIVVETKILRVNSAAAERTGINWSASLGENGTSIEVARSLNSMFGIDSDVSTKGASVGSALAMAESTASQNLVLSPLQLNGVLRALAEGNFATQISNPTLITEDNEQGSISIIDRVPIITATVNQSNGVSNITEEVRYKIDSQDKTISEDPDKHREIGISLTVTPTLLPDGTVRMRLRPRSAQIVDNVVGQSGNVYPRVTESMIESLSRVPDGHSLVVGGFYGEIGNKDRTKVPILGDIPVINFFFKSKDTKKENSSLVFIVTPTSYDPASKSATAKQSSRVHSNVSLTQDHDWVDPECNPGPAHEPNLRRGIRDLRPSQAPYYPTAEEMAPKPAPAPAPASTTTAKRKFSRAGGK
ncbi:secretin N-terminal domain-containing protein [Haloferula sp. BvORR071]|uniref:type II secretion system protein GspD n=1 Tax=Haloferula sp. BvORR071 TaxID=1396141 RepID=UPI0005512D2A|nr:secretin N-terminal domain-containing protein [Haloferula sp. BvORR071]